MRLAQNDEGVLSPQIFFNSSLIISVGEKGRRAFRQPYLSRAGKIYSSKIFSGCGVFPFLKFPDVIATTASN